MTGGGRSGAGVLAQDIGNGPHDTYDVLIDGLWGEEPPDATVEALRFHVSRLRGILRQVDEADRLRTRPRGYQLVLDE